MHSELVGKAGGGKVRASSYSVKSAVLAHLGGSGKHSHMPQPVLIAAELKTGKPTNKRLGQPKPEQQAWLEALKAVGAETYVWRPADWSQILVVLFKD